MTVENNDGGKKTTWRKLTEADIFGKIGSKKVYNSPIKKGQRVLDFRKQEEFGLKKFIKP